MKTHTEAAFETVLLDSLLARGYEHLPRDGFDRERAIFPTVVLDFIRATQPKHWEKLEALHGAKTGERIIHDLCQWLDTHGSLVTLRHGFKCYGRTLRVQRYAYADDLPSGLCAGAKVELAELAGELAELETFDEADTVLCEAPDYWTARDGAPNASM